jgi:hypothetical protein
MSSEFYIVQSGTSYNFSVNFRLDRNMIFDLSQFRSSDIKQADKQK